jgi:single-strand DNA-binding protein
MDNTVTLSGNLTKDFELRYTTSGRGVASAGLAVNRRYQVNGEWQEETSFVNLVAWAELGEHLAASLHKGDRVIVTGRLAQRSYEDREGNKRSVTEVVLDDAGPSLKWAEATVERITREGGSSRAPSPANDPGYDDAEEPF